MDRLIKSFRVGSVVVALCLGLPPIFIIGQSRPPCDVFDSTSNMGQFAQKELMRIKKTRAEQINTQLLGTWGWLSSMYWHDLETPKSCHCNKYMVISKDSIAYFRDGALEKQEPYQLQLKPWHLGKEYFLIQTEDQCWLVKFGREPAVVSQETPGSTLFLEINDTYGVSCGGATHDFEKRE